MESMETVSRAYFTVGVRSRVFFTPTPVGVMREEGLPSGLRKGITPPKIKRNSSW